jgi:hypothetical protein
MDPHRSGFMGGKAGSVIGEPVRTAKSVDEFLDMYNVAGTMPLHDRMKESNSRDLPWHNYVSEGGRLAAAEYHPGPHAAKRGEEEEVGVFNFDVQNREITGPLDLRQKQQEFEELTQPRRRTQ